MNRVERQRLPLHRGVGQRLARELKRKPARDLDEPGAARVDHAGVAEDFEHLGRARESVLPALEDGGEELVRLQAAVLLALALLRHLPDHREHRPLDRTLDRPVRGIARAPERAAEAGRARVLVLAEDVDEAAHDLREDDARSCLARP